MVIDRSALLAMIQREPERQLFKEKIKSARVRMLSAVSFVESSVVISDRYGEPGVDKLDLLLNTFGIEVVPVDHDQALAARKAYKQFGKGNHAAKLNLGACFSYALSKTTGAPLLYKGNDFSRTDVEAA